MSEVRLLMHKWSGSEWVPVQDEDFGGSGNVKYSEPQSLTTEEQTTARSNIGAIAANQALRRYIFDAPEEDGEVVYLTQDGLYEITSTDINFYFSEANLIEGGGFSIIVYEDPETASQLVINDPSSAPVATLDGGSMAFCIPSGDGGYQVITMPAQTGRAILNVGGTFTGPVTFQSSATFSGTLDAAQVRVGSSTVPAGVVTAGAALNSFNFNWSLIGGGSVNDATAKSHRVGSAHYTNSEEPLCVFYSNSSSASVAELRIGGGTNNTHTKIGFYTAANSTTLTGTERMVIDSSGNVGIGITPSVKFHVSGATTITGQTELTGQLATNGTSAMTRDLTNFAVREQHFRMNPVTFDGALMNHTGGVQTSPTIGGGTCFLGFGSAPTAAGGSCRMSQQMIPSIAIDGGTTGVYSGFGGMIDFTVPHAVGFIWATPLHTTAIDVVSRIQMGAQNATTNLVYGIGQSAGYGVKIWYNSSSLWNVALYGKTSTFYNESISGATNASPIVITSNNHNLQNGDLVEIAAVAGNTAANGTFTVAGRTTNTFQLSGSTGNGAYTSGGYAQKITAPITIAAGQIRQMFLVSNGAGTVGLKFGSLNNADSLTLTGMGSVTGTSLKQTGQSAPFTVGFQNINATTAWYGIAVSNVCFYILN